ncbi:hypothetical protein [Mucilaginibacter sp.]|jgi:hypothetical protein|uniref:hypothetical protein n=1 Tax=Mucilaginibacter sp. TaxID=1882438 RepID=UPI00356689FD
MSTILQIEKLSKVYSEEEIKRIDEAVREWNTSDRIEFKIQSTVISGVFKSVAVRVSQPFNESGIYLDRATLISKTEAIFKPFLYGRMLYVDAHPYKPVIIDIVTPEWLEKRMVERGVRVKDIAIDTGIDRTSLSGWISGLRPMSQPVRAMFYFYLIRPADKHNLVSAFYYDLSKAEIGTVIKVVTNYLPEIEIRPMLIRKANELNCQVSIGDFSSEIAEIKFVEKRWITA